MDRMDGHIEEADVMVQDVATEHYEGVDAVTAETGDLLEALGITVDYEGSDYPEFD